MLLNRSKLLDRSTLFSRSVPFRMSAVFGALSACSLALTPKSVLAGYGDVLNLPRGVTPISEEVYDLHMLIFWICTAIGIAVFGVMFWSILHHRKARGVEPAQFHHSTKAEIGWTIIPFLILVGMAIPATKTLIVMEDTSAADLTIKVTGFQWMWRYDYLEDDITLHSQLAPSSRAAIYVDPTAVDDYLLEVDKEVVVPINKKIRLLLTADDVIHAWWVPELGQKKDAIPGFVNEMWTKISKPGVYRGQCAELCGKDHGFMPIVVVAKSEQEYADWVASTKRAQAAERLAARETWTRDALFARGEQVYNAHCVACHQKNGEGVPGAFPAISNSPVATGPLESHLALVLEGRPGSAMRGFADQLNDVELAAVVTYQRNAFGNDSGDLVQPSKVTAVR